MFFIFIYYILLIYLTAFNIYVHNCCSARSYEIEDAIYTYLSLWDKSYFLHSIEKCRI